MNIRFTRYSIIFIFFFLSIITNVVLFILWQQVSQNNYDFATMQKRYPLISKRVLQTFQNDILINFLPLRNKLNTETVPYQNDFALYFEYLPTGTSIGINANDEFTAASLLKVPVVMAYYHKKEQQGISKDPVVSIRQSELNSDYGNLYKKGAGYKINLSDAVKLALQQSDNTASLVLADQITNDDFKFVYEGLDIPLTLQGESPIITAREYVSVFKALYFASILSNDDSEKILEMLTKTEFKNMLPAGVPPGIPVAHKIGLINKQIYQDCGIVYLPNRPYALCMVSKSDIKTAASRMQEISKEVYDYVSHQ